MLPETLIRVVETGWTGNAYSLFSRDGEKVLTDLRIYNPDKFTWSDTLSQTIRKTDLEDLEKVLHSRVETLK